MYRHDEREHIPTVTSAYGAFLSALHDPPAPLVAELPRVTIPGVSRRSMLRNCAVVLLLLVVVLLFAYV